MQEFTHGLCLHAKFHRDWFTVSPLRGEKPEILPHFQLQHSVVAPPCSAETKLNTGAQLLNLLKKSFTACRPLVMANSAFRLGRIC